MAAASFVPIGPQIVSVLLPFGQVVLARVVLT